MIKAYVHIEDPRIYGIYVIATCTLYLSSNPDAITGTIYIK